MQTRCDEVAEALVAQDLHAVALHGGRSQSEREAALREFRNGSTNILVITIALLENLLLEYRTSLKCLSELSYGIWNVRIKREREREATLMNPWPLHIFILGFMECLQEYSYKHANIKK